MDKWWWIEKAVTIIVFVVGGLWTRHVFNATRGDRKGEIQANADTKRISDAFERIKFLETEVNRLHEQEIERTRREEKLRAENERITKQSQVNAQDLREFKDEHKKLIIELKSKNDQILKLNADLLGKNEEIGSLRQKVKSLESEVGTLKQTLENHNIRLDN
jgi:chromosome segregation ATPase